MGEIQPDDVVTFHIKNPGRTDENFKISVPIDTTVGELAEMISRQYDGHPDPSIQTLIYAGKVLKDTKLKIRDILPQHLDPTAPQSMHLVIRSSSAQPQQQFGQSSNSGSAPTPTPAAHPMAAAGSSSAGASTSAGYAGAGPSTSASNSNPYASDGAGYPSAGHNNSTEGAGDSTTASTSQHTMGPSTSNTDASQAPPMLPMVQPYLVMNPIFAAAYSAAYTAALTAALSLQAQQQAAQQAGQPSTSMNAFAPAPAFALYYPQYQYQYPQNAQFQGTPPPRPYNGHAVQGMYGYPYGMQPGMQPGGFPMQPYPQHMYGAPQHPQHQQPGPRQRFFSVSLTRAAAQGDANQRRQRPPRVWTIRISMRTLLQLLVFGVVLYQHCTLHRFLVLTAMAVLLYLTRYWAPLRRFIANLAHPQQPPAGAPAAAAAGGPQADGQAPASPPAPPRNSILREIAMLVLGFLTSLLPAWNYNPEDAAAFAAAQQAVAQEEERLRQQQQQQQQQDGEGGEGNGQQPPNHPHQD